MAVYWGEKRYHSLDYYLKNTYGSKLYKLSLNGGMTCPNRDGSEIYLFAVDFPVN